MTILDYDSSGFIVGIDRMSKGIDNVHDDTQEIVQILKSQNQIANTRMSELTRSIQKSNHQARQQSTLSANRIHLPSSPRQGQPAPLNARNSESGNRSTISRNSINPNERARQRSSTSGADRNSTGASSERDAQGRFLSGSSKDSSSSFKGLGHGNINTSGVDPVLDSMREAKELLSPLGRGTKLAARGVKFSASKLKALKRREPLPNDQTRHNNENVKLLDKIWKAIRKQRGGGGRGLGGGLLGSLLGGGRGRRGGGLLGRLTGFLGKKLPYIGAAIGAGSLANNWGDMTDQEKAAGVGKQGGMVAGMAAGAAGGAVVGSVVPVIGTAIGGLVGAGIGGWIGSGAGEALGNTASPYIESWTSAITAYNLPKKMGDTWDNGIKPFFTRMDSIAGKMNTWLEGKMTGAADFVSGAAGLAMDGMGFGDEGLGSLSAKYEGKIGSANPDNKGWAYGKYQFNSETGGLDQFFQDNPDYAKQFSGLTPASDGFNKKWKDIAANDGENFGKAQDKSAAKLWYAPAAKSAKEKGFKMDDRGVQEAIFSGSIQHGGIKKVIASASSQKGFADMNAEQQIEAFYKSRRAYARKNVKPSVMKGLDKRYDAESQDAVALSRSSKQKDEVKAALKSAVSTVAEVITPNTPADTSKENASSVSRKAKLNNSALGVSLGGMTATNPSQNTPTSELPLIFKPSASKTVNDFSSAPANLPSIPTLKLPVAQKMRQRLDSGGDNKPMIMQSSSDTINQNVSDRDLAHAITGGLGQGRFTG